MDEHHQTMPQQAAATTPQSVNSAVLRTIADQVIEQLRLSESLRAGIEFGEYHGFRKARLPAKVLTSILGPLGITDRDVQIEVVEVAGDLTHQVHTHREATAHVVVLGADHGYPEPSKGYWLLHFAEWRHAESKKIVTIPKGIVHGFTVEPGGKLFFLSVQSPPIVRESGEDDYHPHTQVPLDAEHMYERGRPRRASQAASGASAGLG